MTDYIELVRSDKGENMLVQDAERTEKLTQRMQQLDVTYNNVKLLTDMLYNYQPDATTESDKEIMKVC